MKIVDIHGHIVAYPLKLGQRGPGRHEEEVRVDARRPPNGSTDVGYAVFSAGGHQHCVLTSPTGQRGILVRVDTHGTYTKYSDGSIAVVHGDVTVLAEGQWAFGAAGKIGNGPDQLLHVVGCALLIVVTSGGTRKGHGRCYVVIDSDRGYVRRCTPVDLVQDLATDEDPILGEVVRSIPRDALPRDIAEALEAADRLEVTDAPTVSCTHYLQREVPDTWRLPPGHSGGLSRGPNGVLLPGEQSLVCLAIGPGGGKRYGYAIDHICGLDVLHRESRRASELILALVTAADWRVEWRESKDGVWGESLIATAESCAGESWGT
jgi:hypothetical protein